MSHEQRVRNLEAIINCVGEHNKKNVSLTIPKLRAKILRDVGVSEKTADNYIKDLEQAGKIELRNGTVWANR